jgi:GTP pyrophosphokinase
MTVPEATARPDDAVVLELEPVLRAYRTHHGDASDSAIHRAYALAHRLHAGQFRKSGEPFISHPLTVAQILAEYGMDGDTIAAAILHDTVEDTDLQLEEVERDFGEEVARLIDGVTKLDRLDFQSAEQQQAATIRKMVVAMAADVRVLLIKLADRLHNVRTLFALDPEKQRRKAQETLEVYAPLAHRLGVQEIKHEMEDRCFAILYPKRNAEIEELISQRAGEREAFIEKATLEVSAELERSGLEGEVSGRPKHPYSIYRKMMESGLPFEDIHDVIGIRIVVDSVRDCYAALGTVHTMWPPVHGRFKDYIAMPKFNLYQSLHTTVVGPDGKPLEVQIRTREMHARAEFGIASHWRYKEGESPAELEWMSDIRFLQEEYTDPAEFLSNLKIDLYQDEVFALTPKGDVITLPRGATPIDFAYAVHTEVGHRCVGAKVNGRLVPLATELTSGDIVEVTTSKAPDAGPSRDWLRFVKGSRASAKIRQWFSRERRAAALAKGRENLHKALEREGFDLKAAERDRILGQVAERMGYQDLDPFYVGVGEGNIHTETIVARVAGVVRPDEDSSGDDLIHLPTATTSAVRHPTLGVVVEGLDDMLVNIARCCAPVPGDNIIGFVTTGRGVSVHRADCTNIFALGERSERMIEVVWDADRGDAFSVWLQVEALDRTRLLRDVTTVLSDIGANIVASSSATGRDRVAVLRYEVELSDTAQLDRAVAELRNLEGVFDAYRLLPGGSHTD